MIERGTRVRVKAEYAKRFAGVTGYARGRVNQMGTVNIFWPGEHGVRRPEQLNMNARLLEIV